MTDSARHRSATLKPVPRLAIPPRPPSPLFTPKPRPGFRAHLAHLLPRHAAFTVTLTVHQLHNVPLVHGEFGLRWKIKGVTSNAGNGILDRVKARKASAKLCDRSHSGTTVAKGSDTDSASLLDAASDAQSAPNGARLHSNGHASKRPQRPTHAHPLPIPAVVVSTNHPSPPSMARSTSYTSSIASASSASSVSSASNGHPTHNPPGYLSADWSREYGDTATKLHYSPAKGITPFVKLREHSVVWEKALKFVVEMSVGRDNDELGDCLAKLVVMQRVIAGDPDAPRNPRLGAVYLNLAQYVNAGAVTRRYLLRQSKTNATLKLTIHLEHTAGELTYVAPSLPKGEILSGVTGFLESSDIYRARPRTSDLYMHASSDSSSEDDLDGVSGSDASSIFSGSVASNVPSQTHSHDHAHSDNHRHATIKKHRRPFEIAKLPTINDPRGTEKLIEALFNPVPVTLPSKVTPFTYLVEVDGEGDGEHGSDQVVGHAAAGHADQGARRGMMDVDDDGSLYADSQDESEGEGEAGGMKSDYHSLRSHPSVQGSLRSKRSTRSLASKVALKREDREDGEVAGVSTGVQPPGGATERRTWWQKALSPSAG
ncbi:N-terminal C2 in EEIG1 and EHBP1 proteins-domain-containing protein [Boletus coccyginus]|nr:N-terminal C2 in EEIG1 and EHBP1 proteins-domain-containing protein [Boletus coccyginus]